MKQRSFEEAALLRVKKLESIMMTQGISHFLGAGMMIYLQITEC
jgi:hypothetical protein